MHQGYVMSPFLFEVVVDFVTEIAREDELSELLYTDDLALMRETIELHRNNLLKWMEACESKG